MVIIGIDPGISGAICSIGVTMPGALRALRVYDMPVMMDIGTERNHVNCVELDRILRELSDQRNGNLSCEVWIEKVHAVPPSSIVGKGKMQQGATGAFGMGRNFGNIEGVVAACKLVVRYVHSSVWKRKADLMKKPKEASRALAIQMFPDAELHLKKHEARAEALLIARHGAMDWLARMQVTPAPK